MRTTVAIDDYLLEAAKERARARGTTLGGLIEEALRRELARATQRSPGPPVPVFHGAGGVRPGVDAASNQALLEALDDERALEQLR